MAELYAYFLCDVGLFRVKIPDYEFDTASKHKFIIEWVFYNPSKPLPSSMGLFSYGHKLYMAGGQEGKVMYIFKPRDDDALNQLCPLVDYHQFNDVFSTQELKPMFAPCVIRGPDNNTYFLSEYDYGSGSSEPFCFQYYNPDNHGFSSLPCPPYILDCGTTIVPYKALGHFYVCGYIYLFVTETVNFRECVRAFTFDTTLLEWKERKELVGRFEKREIPIPRLHSGDVGLFSYDFFDKNTHVMVALHASKPTAYLVRLCAGGSLRPKSYRILDEVDNLDCRGSSANERTHLFDIGGGRFGVIYHSDYVSLQIYVFKIDVAHEYYIQTDVIHGEDEVFSSEILSSKKFRDPIPCFNNSRISAVCLAQVRDEEEVKNRKRKIREAMKRCREARKRCSYK